MDGQFQKAGFSPDRIVEAHGSIHHTQCMQCDRGIQSAAKLQVVVDMRHFRALDIPRCEACGGVLRPNVCMFDDFLTWDESRALIQQSRFEKWLHKRVQKGENLLIIEIGAGKKLPAIRQKGEAIAKAYGATMIRINPRDDKLDKRLGVSLGYGALEVLEILLG